MSKDAEKRGKQKLADSIVCVLEAMELYGPDSPEYPALLENLDKLTKVQQTSKSSRKFSLDTVILAAANILGIVIIVAYEQKHVIRSKATDFLMKAR